jgi:Ca2+-binding RTX toxin-like protein
MRRLVIAIVVAALVAVFVPGGAPAHAIGAPVPDLLIDFEQDTLGFKANGFTSADSPFVHFSDTNGAQLEIADLGAQGEGARTLLARTDFDNSALRMVLDRPSTRVSFRFGNDDPNFTEPGDEAVLTAFRGTTQVGQSRVVINRNDAMDQTITFANGPVFNRLVFKMDVDPTVGLIEVIDHLVFAPLCTIAGTEAGQTLVGTPGNDVICAGGGNDTVFGRAGRDHIIGGNGADTLNGEDGEDFIAGNFQNDTIHGGNQNDRVEGGQENDKVFGDAGNDFVSGGPGTDTCNGGTGTDTPAGCETAIGF